MMNVKYILFYYFFPFILLAMYIVMVCMMWLRTTREHEPNLKWKTVGYLILASFKITINLVQVPIGLILAIILANRARQNAHYKKRIVIFGIVLYIISFIPIASTVNQLLFPRDQISTYLIDATYPNLHYSIQVHNDYELVRSDSPDSSHEIVAELYKELLRSSYSHESMRVINNWNMQIYFHSLPKNYEPFQHAQLYVSNDYTQLSVVYENQIETFVTTERFQELFAQFVTERSILY